MEPTSYTDTIEPGSYYADVPNEVYHSMSGISKSGLDLINRSPAHYAHRVARAPSRNMEMGTAIHTALLEPERFATDYMLLREVKDRRTSAYKEAVKVYGSERTLTGPEADKVAGMQEAVYANPHARKLLESDGWRELSGMANDPETGATCRHRFDLLTVDGIAVDVKKTQDARPEAFQRSVYNYRYHVQAAFYADQYYWITGNRLKGFMFLAIEEEMPHGVQVYYLDDSSLAIGREEYRADLARYARCITDSDWPAYDSRPSLLSLPDWVLSRYENDLEDGGII